MPGLPDPGRAGSLQFLTRELRPTVTVGFVGVPARILPRIIICLSETFGLVLSQNQCMPVRISKNFRFEAAHWLPGMPEGHKCRRLHGHSFKIEVHLVGETDPETGILIDFGDIKTVVKPYIEMLDHYCLNEVGERLGDPLLCNPSSENLAQWFYEQLNDQLPGLYSVVVHETCTSRCEYRQQF